MSLFVGEEPQVQVRRAVHTLHLKEDLRLLAQDESYWDVTLHCSDGVLQLNRLTAGLAFTQLSDEETVICKDYSTAEVETYICRALSPDWREEEEERAVSRGQRRHSSRKLARLSEEEEKEVDWMTCDSLREEEEKESDCPEEDFIIPEILVGSADEDDDDIVIDDDDFFTDTDAGDCLTDGECTESERIVQSLIRSVVNNLERYKERYEEKERRRAAAESHCDDSMSVCVSDSDVILSPAGLDFSPDNVRCIDLKVDVKKMALSPDDWGQIKEALRRRCETGSFGDTLAEDEMTVMKKVPHCHHCNSFLDDSFKKHMETHHSDIQRSRGRPRKDEGWLEIPVTVKREMPIPPKAATSSLADFVFAPESSADNQPTAEPMLWSVPPKRHFPPRPHEVGHHKRRRHQAKRVRCGHCAHCLVADCAECRYCLDKKKFGGKGVLKQSCIARPECALLEQWTDQEYNTHAAAVQWHGHPYSSDRSESPPSLQINGDYTGLHAPELGTLTALRMTHFSL